MGYGSLVKGRKSTPRPNFERIAFSGKRRPHSLLGHFVLDEHGEVVADVDDDVRVRQLVREEGLERPKIKDQTTVSTFDCS